MYLRTYISTERYMYVHIDVHDISTYVHKDVSTYRWDDVLMYLLKGICTYISTYVTGMYLYVLIDVQESLSVSHRHCH